MPLQRHSNIILVPCQHEPGHDETAVAHHQASAQMPPGGGGEDSSQAVKAFLDKTLVASESRNGTNTHRARAGRRERAAPGWCSVVAQGLPHCLLMLLLLLLLHTGGTDPVTGAADLCAHVRIAPALRNAALNLVGADLYKKVKPPGDTSLHTYALCRARGQERQLCSSTRAPCSSSVVVLCVIGMVCCDVWDVAHSIFCTHILACLRFLLALLQQQCLEPGVTRAREAVWCRCTRSRPCNTGSSMQPAPRQTCAPGGELCRVGRSTAAGPSHTGGRVDAAAVSSPADLLLPHAAAGSEGPQGGSPWPKMTADCRTKTAAAGFWVCKQVSVGQPPLVTRIYINIIALQ